MSIRCSSANIYLNLQINMLKYSYLIHVCNGYRFFFILFAILYTFVFGKQRFCSILSELTLVFPKNTGFLLNTGIFHFTEARKGTI